MAAGWTNAWRREWIRCWSICQMLAKKWANSWPNWMQGSGRRRAERRSKLSSNSMGKLRCLESWLKYSTNFTLHFPIEECPRGSLHLLQSPNGLVDLHGTTATECMECQSGRLWCIFVQIPIVRGVDPASGQHFGQDQPAQCIPLVPLSASYPSWSAQFPSIPFLI